MTLNMHRHGLAQTSCRKLCTQDLHTTEPADICLEECLHLQEVNGNVEHGRNSRGLQQMSRKQASIFKVSTFFYPLLSRFMANKTRMSDLP
jgi:hypothetical protein